jgi:predicted amidohydrolase
MNLAAGALSMPTTGSTTEPGARIAVLRSCINELIRYRTAETVKAPTRWAGASGRPSLVLVAPEYMFVRRGFRLQAATDLKRNRFLEKGDRDNIIAELQKLSAEFGKQLIFVPGSIASREELPAHGSADRNEAVKMAKQHIRTSAQWILNYDPNLTPKEVMKVETANPLGGYKAITPRQKIHKLREMDKATTGKQYLADNVAYLFNNGKQLARYAKHGDFHERLPQAATHTIFVPGIAPGRATVGGINFGIEICLDHGLGTLKNTKAVTGELSRVHLLCSAAVEPELGAIAVRDGGYFIHASSELAWTSIQRKRGVNWEPPIDPDTAVVGGHTLKMGTIELDL